MSARELVVLGTAGQAWRAPVTTSATRCARDVAGLMVDGEIVVAADLTRVPVPPRRGTRP